MGQYFTPPGIWAPQFIQYVAATPGLKLGRRLLTIKAAVKIISAMMIQGRLLSIRLVALYPPCCSGVGVAVGAMYEV